MTGAVEDVSRRVQIDAGLAHLGQLALLAAVEVDGGGGFLDHGDVEAGLSRVDRRPGDAVVERQAAEYQPREAACLQIAVETGARHAVVLAERRIGIDAGVEALAHDHLHLGGLEVGMKVSARRALHAMVRPQRLRAVRKLRRGERLGITPGAGERGMARRMPVLRQHDMVVAAHQAVDQRHDRARAWDGESAALAEVVLHVDHDQRLVRHYARSVTMAVCLRGLVLPRMRRSRDRANRFRWRP